jgi:hypothetical protein
MERPSPADGCVRTADATPGARWLRAGLRGIPVSVRGARGRSSGAQRREADAALAAEAARADGCDADADAGPCAEEAAALAPLAAAGLLAGLLAADAAIAELAAALALAAREALAAP